MHLAGRKMNATAAAAASLHAIEKMGPEMMKSSKTGNSSGSGPVSQSFIQSSIASVSTPLASTEDEAARDPHPHLRLAAVNVSILSSEQVSDKLAEEVAKHVLKATAPADASVEKGASAMPASNRSTVTLSTKVGTTVTASTSAVSLAGPALASTGPETSTAVMWTPQRWVEVPLPSSLLKSTEIDEELLYRALDATR